MYSEYTTQYTLHTQHTKYVNNDNVGMPTVILFKHYIFNILSSDYFSVLKLYRKFEKSCNMLWYNFHND